MRPEPGAALADGRYRLLEHLGSGGMASVWLARDETLDRPVAIKLMAEHLADDPRWLKRFAREAKAAAALVHPNIVSVFDFGTEEHRAFLVMAYLPGGNLKDCLQRGEGVPPAAQVARELLGALAHVHAAGLLHRDIKPANILLDAEGRSHLTDFGIARAEDATALTQTGMVLGTMRYLAPEVAHGEPASQASDLYAAGVVLREIGAPNDAPHLQALIRRLTAENPAVRPSSAQEALEILDADRTAPTRVLGEGTTAATHVLRRPAALPPLHAIRRSPWFVPGAGLAGVLVLAVLVIGFAGGGDSPSATVTPGGDQPLQQQLRELDRAIDAAR